MKILRSFLLLTCLMSGKSFGQSVYYGYPSLEKDLKKGDAIFINVPRNLHGGFEENDEINLLVRFINSHADVHFNIAINIFFESPEFDKYLSESLQKSMTKILVKHCAGATYIVSGVGQSNPIFLSPDSKQFSKMNTRIDILIE